MPVRVYYEHGQVSRVVLGRVGFVLFEYSFSICDYAVLLSSLNGVTSFISSKGS